MIAIPATNTPTPEIAERPASSKIDDSTSGVAASTPAFRSHTTRAAGVQIPPGTYFASMEAISDCNATAYEIRTSSARRIHCHPTTNRQ